MIFASPNAQYVDQVTKNIGTLDAQATSSVQTVTRVLADDSSTVTVFSNNLPLGVNITGVKLSSGTLTFYVTNNSMQQQALGTSVVFNIYVD